MTNAARHLPTPTPFLRLLSDMTDQNETREAPTLAPETDRDQRGTLPPDAADDVKAADRSETLLPPTGEPRPKGASQRPSDFFEAAYNKLVEVHEQQGKRDQELYDEHGKFAGLLGSIIDRSLTGFAKLLEPRLVTIEKNLAKLERQHAQLKEDTERRFAEFERLIADLKEERDTPEPAAPTG